MFNRICILLCLSLFSFACSKKDLKKAEKIQTVQYPSAISYQVVQEADKNVAARVEDNPVPWSQLLTGDVALQELQTRYEQKALAFAYAVAAQTNSQKIESLSLFMEKPSIPVEDILKKENVEFVEGIRLEFKGYPYGKSLAQVGAKTLTWDDFKKANMAHSHLYKRLFNQRLQRLNGVVVRRLLLKAAKESNQAMEAYVQAHIVKEAYQPSEDEIRAFAKDKNIQEKSLDENMMKRLRDIIVQRHRDKKIETYVAEKLLKKPVTIAFVEPVIQIQEMGALENLPQWGSQGPGILFVGHWDCEGCDQALKSFLRAKQKLNKTAKGQFLYSFADVNREARMGAEAGFCVQDQDQNRFWTFLEKMMDVKESNVEERINIAAQGSGIDFDQFRDCFLKRRHQERVDTHLNYAKQMGITRAPLLILNGHVLSNPVEENDITEKLNSLGLLQKAEKKSFFARLWVLLGF